MDFYIDSTKEQLEETFVSWMKESETYHEVLLRDQKIAEQYYYGDQTDKNMVPEYKSDYVGNRVYEAVETMVPVATATAHQFLVLPGSESEDSIHKAEKLQKVLSRKYDSLFMQQKLEDGTRHLLLFKFGVLKYLWSERLDDVDVKVTDPRLIYIPKLHCDPHELPYVMEEQTYDEDEFAEYFPDADANDFQKSDKKDYKVFEVWTDEMVAWFCQGKLLEKKANPHFDFEGDEKNFYILRNGKRKKKTNLVFRNHLDRPEKPYVFLSTFNVGETPIPDKGWFEQVRPVQDGLNHQKRRIIDNLRSMGNGTVLVDADAMSQEESDNITDEPGLIIRGKGVASENKIRRDPGVPLPNGHFANHQASNVEFDNIAGTHGAVRGAAAAKTLGQDILSRQQDFSRIDLITRVLNRAVWRLANGLTQLMRRYYDAAHVIKILGEDGAVEFVKFNQDDIEDHIEIYVKSGQTLPMDEVSLRSEAVQLWQLGALDPVTLGERLKMPNPEKYAQRLLAWKQGQLTMETQAKIAQIQAGGQERMKAQITSDAMKEQGRGVETPMNVMQRARQNLGGTAPAPVGNVAGVST